jgi:hypothetical protein
MIQDDEIAVLKVEAVKLVTGLLCVYDIFVDNKGGAFCVVGDSLTNLTSDGSAGGRRMSGKDAVLTGQDRICQRVQRGRRA